MLQQSLDLFHITFDNVAENDWNYVQWHILRFEMHLMEMVYYCNKYATRRVFHSILFWD